MWLLFGFEPPLSRQSKPKGLQLPMPARRSLTTRDVVVRESEGADGEGGGAAPLPPNWEAHEDEQGQIYFYNTVSEQVRWEAP